MKDSSKILYAIISGILSLVLLVGAVLMSIPSTRVAIADKVATNLSPAYAEIKDDNAKKDSQINNLNNEINNLNKTILEKDASIEEKNIAIAEKDSLISSQTEQLNTCNANIKTLSSQKVTLLTAVSEIDNKINSTTDSVELEDLETRKTAILAQIDTLNTQISTLQAQKTQLEQDIATLQQEKATLQAEVNQLKQDKAELQNQVENLQNQKTTLQEQVNNFSKVTTITLENYPGCMMPDPISIIDTITNINYATNNSNVQSATVFNISGNLKFSLGYSFSSVGEKYYIYVDGVKQPYQMGYNFEFLADSLNHTIKFEAPTMVSKWKLNSQISTDGITSDKTFKINGCVDGRFYFDSLYFNVSDSSNQTINIENSVFGAGPWLSEYCNTNICFETEPTGELLTWLQANATQVTE